MNDSGASSVSHEDSPSDDDTIKIDDPIAFRNRIIIIPRSLMILYLPTRVLEFLE